MPDVLKEAIFGVQLGGILLALIRLFRPKLELFEFLGIGGVAWAIAFAAGLMGGLFAYSDWIAATVPVVVTVIQVSGAILVPFLMALGFWEDLARNAKSVWYKHF